MNLYKQFNELFCCTYDKTIALKYIENTLFIIKIEKDLFEFLGCTNIFTFIENSSFYPKEKEILFYNDAVFNIDKLRFVEKEEIIQINSTKQLVIKRNYFEISINLVSLGINKFDNFRFSNGDYLNMSSIPINNKSDQLIPLYDCITINSVIRYNTSMKVFYLKGNNLGSFKSTNSLVNYEKMCCLLEKNYFLIGLNISNNALGNLGIKFLSKVIRNSNHLKWINLAENKIGNEGIEYLVEAMRINKSLNWLDLSENEIGDEGLEILSESLCDNKNLKHLELACNVFCDHGILKFSCMIKINNILEWVDLSGNKITLVGVKALFQALSFNVVLNYMNLWNILANYRDIRLIERLNITNKEIEY
jgi:hypothetical protein